LILKELKNYIFEEFSKKLETQIDIDNIIKLIDCIEGKQKEKKEKENDEEEDKNLKKGNDIREIILNEFLKKLIDLIIIFSP